MHITEKQCTKCGVVKAAECFSPDRRRADWLQGQCKGCRRDQQKADRAAHPEKHAEISRRSFARNRKAGTENRLAWKRRNRDKVRNYTLKGRYGITAEDVECMREAQGQCCALCGKALTARAHTDHCHSSGVVRGIICGGCNIGLGFIEKPGFLKAALAYLARDARSAARP